MKKVLLSLSLLLVPGFAQGEDMPDPLDAFDQIADEQGLECSISELGLDADTSAAVPGGSFFIPGTFTMLCQKKDAPVEYNNCPSQKLKPIEVTRKRLTADDLKRKNPETDAEFAARLILVAREEINDAKAEACPIKAEKGCNFKKKSREGPGTCVLDKDDDWVKAKDGTSDISASTVKGLDTVTVTAWRVCYFKCQICTEEKKTSSSSSSDSSIASSDSSDSTSSSDSSTSSYPSISSASSQAGSIDTTVVVGPLADPIVTNTYSSSYGTASSYPSALNMRMP